MKKKRFACTEAEIQQNLSPEEYRICRQKGTERAFSGKYLNCKKKGTYLCTVCSESLFLSDDKFDSGTGWPSFTKPIDTKAVSYAEDQGMMMSRTEVLCANCGSHLGHVFPDGPVPTQQRFCVNSVALKFQPSRNND